MSAYRNNFDETKYISFLIKDNELLENYNEIYENVSNASGKEFNSNPVYNKKYLRAKIKSYNGQINAMFHGNKLLRESSQFICLSVIVIESAFKLGNNYYHKCFRRSVSIPLKNGKSKKRLPDYRRSYYLALKK